MNNWTRKDLKARAKISFKKNYWKCVLVALILAVISGGIGGSIGGIIGSTTSNFLVHNDYVYESDEYYDDFSDDDFYDMDLPDEYNDYDVDDIDDFDINEYFDSRFPNEMIDDGSSQALFAALLAVLLVVVLFCGIIGLAISAFLINPLTLGGQRFFYRNNRENAELDNLGFGFRNNYLNNVKIMFFRDIKTIGWSLLLVIPGIIKSYEYMMIPYILQDNPEMNSKEAFSLSKVMMTGNKWKAFVLDLSFIGWLLLSAITAGIVGIFYVNPYIYQTKANLYASLKGDYAGNIDDKEEPVRADAAEEQVVEFDI